MRRKKQPDGPTMERFERLCRQRGLALTIQRRAVYAAICGRRDHPTADQVYQAVRRQLPQISRTTVYRVLETLAAAGIIAKAPHASGAARYDPATHRHHHLVCRVCNRIVDFQDSRLDGLAVPDAQRHGFEIEDYIVHFVGLCDRCRGGRSPAGRGSSGSVCSSSRRRSAGRERVSQRRKGS